MQIDFQSTLLLDSEGNSIYYNAIKTVKLAFKRGWSLPFRTLLKIQLLPTLLASLHARPQNSSFHIRDRPIART